MRTQPSIHGLLIAAAAAGSACTPPLPGDGTDTAASTTTSAGPGDTPASTGQEAPTTDPGTSTGAGTSTGTSASTGTGDEPTTGESTSTGEGPTDPEEFWDHSDIPPATNVMTFKFLNRTNGKFDDSEVFWSFKSGDISELHSIAEQPTYDMPANASGRMYFYICAPGEPIHCEGDPSKSKFFDFIEHTIGPNQYNGNTTRVDAFGLKLALLLHCADGWEATVGEDYQTFADDREVTFQQFRDAVPPAFRHLAEPPFAPYRIVEPGAGEFGEGGMYADYYAAFIDEMWANNGLQIAKPGPNGSGLAAHPNLSAAIFRHVGAEAGTFMPDGTLAIDGFWDDPGEFYTAEPANFYAKFWHDHGLDGKAYGFPYDDVGSYSTYISHEDPEYMLVAIGW
ncbi:beta-1,3-glucanase family protein [Nannocystis punicea]|uniref:Beta-1,3-glucanase family protein n=1 Tax=Nannocystis punicea TaxID=2995304 RepID=A0ABY7GU49_9BACT|nr:beta-1,3-glucanase family protein [Nannocystis poenicansa]WAS90495.1 beta-1,3-glucanase family protein [Nannocystis poenicansa]